MSTRTTASKARRQGRKLVVVASSSEHGALVHSVGLVARAQALFVPSTQIVFVQSAYAL